MMPAPLDADPGKEVSAALDSNGNESNRYMVPLVDGKLKATQVQQWKRDIVQMTNRERNNSGLDPVLPSPHLDATAQWWADTMASTKVYKHSDLKNVVRGKLPLSWGTIGENIGMGQTSARDVFENPKLSASGNPQSWMASQGHRDNILRDDYNRIGIGIAADDTGRVYWVQHFGDAYSGTRAADIDTAMYRAPASLDVDPAGTVTSASAKGASITIRGWAFDRDDADDGADIRVTIDGTPYSVSPSETIAGADIEWGLNTNDIGFSFTSPALPIGRHAVVVTALNVKGGHDTQIMSSTISTFTLADGAGTSPTATVTPPTTPPAPTPERLSGDTRYKTSLAVAKESMVKGRPLFVVSGSTFPDALSAAPAAARQGGSLVLSNPGTMDGDMVDLIKERVPSIIYLVGGNGAISGTVFRQMQDIAPTFRVFGSDRYATSLAVYDKFFAGSAESVYLAKGSDFPDALAGSALAGQKGPVVLTRQGTEAARTADALRKRGVTDVTLVGGHDDRPGTERALRADDITFRWIAGSDRYDTAAQIAESLQAGSKTYIATGTDFADALAISGVAATKRTPVVLTRQNCVPSASLGALGKRLQSQRVAVGGVGVVSNQVLDDLTPCG